MTTAGAEDPQDPQVGENVCHECGSAGCDVRGETGIVQELLGDA